MSQPTVIVGKTEGPSEHTAAKDGAVEISDARGRRLVVKKLKAIARMRLMKILGAEGSSNPNYAAYAILAASCIKINDVPYAEFAGSLLEIEAKVTTLDDDGLDAIAKALRAMEPEEQDAADVAKN